MAHPKLNNSALSLMWALGGVFQAIIEDRAERKDIEDFRRRDAKENPPEPRIAQPLRSYNKRYTHALTSVQTRLNQAKLYANKK